MRVTLVYPPSRNVPASPYGALPMLAAALRARGHGVALVDADLELFERLVDPALIEAGWADLEAAIATATSGPGGAAHREALDSLQSAPLESLLDATAAPDVLRSWDLFLDPVRVNRVYDGARNLMRVAFAGSPTESPHAVGFLDRTLGRLEARAGGLSEQLLCESAVPRILATEPDMVGISVPFREQLYEALVILRELRAARPELQLTIGGPTVDIWERLLCADPRMFALYDHAVSGDGTQALPDLADALDGRGAIEDVPNLFRRLPDGGIAPPGRRAQDDLDALPTPDFDGLELGRYFLPAPILSYQSSRGCYYGKCTFCSDELKLGFRARREELVLADLEAMQAQTGSPFVFFWDPLTPPRLLRTVARWNRGRPVPLRWGAETKFERTFAVEAFVRELGEGGARFLQFGYESASQTVLDAMDKGTDMALVPRMLDLLRDHKIAVSVQWFIGYPGETEEEARESFRFLDRRRDAIVASAYMGTLTIDPDTDLFRDGQELHGIEMVARDDGVFTYRYGDGRPREDRGELDMAYRARSDFETVLNGGLFLYSAAHPDRSASAELTLFTRAGALPDTWAELEDARPTLPPNNYVTPRPHGGARVHVTWSQHLVDLDAVDRDLMERADGERTAAEITAGVAAADARDRLLWLVRRGVLAVPRSEGPSQPDDAGERSRDAAAVP